MNLRYYADKVWKFFGYCRNCHNKLNFTRTGAGVCPYCGRRY